MVRIPGFDCCGMSSVPDWGTPIPQGRKRKRHTDGNRYVKRCSTSLIIREITNQNHNETLSHTCYNGCYQKDKKLVSVRMGNGNPVHCWW